MPLDCSYKAFEYLVKQYNLVVNRVGAKWDEAELRSAPNIVFL